MVVRIERAGDPFNPTAPADVAAFVAGARHSYVPRAFTVTHYVDIMPTSPSLRWLLCVGSVDRAHVLASLAALS